MENKEASTAEAPEIDLENELATLISKNPNAKEEILKKIEGMMIKKLDEMLDSLREEHQTEINDWRAWVEFYKKCVIESDKEVGDMKQKLEAAEEAQRHSISTIEAKEAELQESAQLQQNQLVEIENLRANYAKKENSAKILSETVQNMIQKNLPLVMEVKALKQKWEASEEAQRRLKATADAKGGELRGAKERVSVLEAELQKSVESRQKEVESSPIENSRKDKTIGVLSETVQDLIQKNLPMQMEIKELKQKLVESDKKNSKLQEELDDTRISIHFYYMEEHEKDQQKWYEANLEIEELNNKNEQLRLIAKANSEIAVSAKNEAKILKKEIGELKKKLENFEKSQATEVQEAICEPMEEGPELMEEIILEEQKTVADEKEEEKLEHDVEKAGSSALDVEPDVEMADCVENSASDVDDNNENMAEKCDEAEEWF